MRLKTPAKVTLVLHVGTRRKDGYHDVGIALAPVSLYDRLELNLQPDKGLSLEVDSPEDLGSPDRNLVWQAVQVFAKATLALPDFSIHLTKHIPSGAGLGGGSGNAAAALIACNRLWNSPLSHEQLLAEGAKLGSDVPFFVDARPAWAEGRGEQLRALPGLPQLHLIVVKPPFSIATGPAYQRLAEWRAANPASVGDTHGRVPPLNTVDEVVASLHNDFEPPLFHAYPELGEVKACLLAEGALGALLSGTGSAVFGVFADAAVRDRAAGRMIERLARDKQWRILPCDTLAEHAYEPEP